MADKTLPPVAIGDSLAVGMRDANKIPGLSRVGAGPREVLDMIKRFSAENSLSGRDVFIGTGMPNIPEQKKFIEEQVDFVRKQGGNPILFGVGPGTKSKPTTGQNEFLAGLAERKGLPYMGPLANRFPDITKDPMGLHLRGSQYQQLLKQYSKPQSGKNDQSKLIAPMPYSPKAGEDKTPTRVPMPYSPKEGGDKAIRNSIQPMPFSGSAADLLSQFTGAVMQAESRGNRYDKSGKLLTSSAGALGEMQVMPGTVRDPGFGIRPAKDNSPDELARVGRDYAAVMLRRYNNDPTAAAVAYNWGPGNADKWVKRGADFGALPKETQRYVSQITGQMGVPIAAKRVPPPPKRVEKAPSPRAAVGEDYAPGSTLEPAPRTAQQGPATAPPQQDQVTRADMERLGPSYQAAFAAMSLADSREDDDDFYDDDETIAERYMERREMQMAQDESTLEEEEPARVSPLAGLSELSYQSPFPEVQPVMMADGGEARAMMDDLEPTFGQRMGAKLSDVATKGLINIYDAARLTEGALSSKESAAEKEQKMSAAHKIYLDTFGFRGRRDPVTAEYFNPEEQKAIADLIAKKGGQKGSIQYKDYGMDKRKLGPQHVLAGKLDPYVSVNKSLGQFNYELDPKTNSYRVTDQYDFNPLTDVGGRQVSSDFMGDYLSDVPGLYNKARIYAGRHMPPGTGRKVDFTVPAQVPVKRADGSPIYGEVADSGPITEDTRRALANRQSFNPREALAALKRIGTEGVSNLESLARGSMAGVPGVVGDIESLFRDSDKTRRFATSEEVERQYLPKRVTAPTKESQGFVEIGTAIDPSIALKAAPKTAKAALKALKESGPQVEAALMKAAPTAQPMNIIKYEGGNWLPVQEGERVGYGHVTGKKGDAVNKYISSLLDDSEIAYDIGTKKKMLTIAESRLNSVKDLFNLSNQSTKRIYQQNNVASASRKKKIEMAEGIRPVKDKNRRAIAEAQIKVEEAQAELAGPQSIANFIEKKLQPYIRNDLGTESDQVRIRMDKWELEEQPKLIAEKQKQIDKVRADIERAAAARGDINPLMLTRSQEQLRKLMNEMEGIKSRTGSFAQFGSRQQMEEIANIDRDVRLQASHSKRRNPERRIFGELNYPNLPSVGKSVSGRAWESKVDQSIDAYTPAEAMESIQGTPPAWLTKMAEPEPDTVGIYSLGPWTQLDPHFHHLIDELKSSVDPLSNIPKELRRTPKEIEKMSVEDAAVLVDKINGWRASNTTGLNLRRANSPAVAEVKTYKTVPNTDLPNEKNLRWVEIKMPENMPKDEGKRILNDSLKYEGELMNHCVGTYCPNVEKGTKIFSLRDIEGQPYTTIEAVPDMNEAREIIRSNSRDHFGFSGLNEKDILKEVQQLGFEIPYRIKQIKGERNGAPIEEVVPFVRDFVSDPKWTDVANLNLIGGL